MVMMSSRSTDLQRSCKLEQENVPEEMVFARHLRLRQKDFTPRAPSQRKVCSFPHRAATASSAYRTSRTRMAPSSSENGERRALCARAEVLVGDGTQQHCLIPYEDETGYRDASRVQQQYSYVLLFTLRYFLTWRFSAQGGRKSKDKSCEARTGERRSRRREASLLDSAENGENDDDRDDHPVNFTLLNSLLTRPRHHRTVDYDVYALRLLRSAFLAWKHPRILVLPPNSFPHARAATGTVPICFLFRVWAWYTRQAKKHRRDCGDRKRLRLFRMLGECFSTWRRKAAVCAALVAGKMEVLRRRRQLRILSVCFHSLVPPPSAFDILDDQFLAIQQRRKQMRLQMNGVLVECDP